MRVPRRSSRLALGCVALVALVVLPMLLQDSATGDRQDRARTSAASRVDAARASARAEERGERAERSRSQVAEARLEQASGEGVVAMACDANEAPTPPLPALPAHAEALEPSPAAIAAFELASEKQDRVALLELARSEPSVVRYGALRLYLQLEGASGLNAILPLLGSSDAVLRELVGDAAAAGGDGSTAIELAGNLAAGAAGSAEARALRRASARAILAIRERASVDPSVELAAVQTLVTLTRAGDAEALDALSSTPAALIALGADSELAADLRLQAAEFLRDSGYTDEAKSTLSSIALGPPSPAQRHARSLLP